MCGKVTIGVGVTLAILVISPEAVWCQKVIEREKRSDGWVEERLSDGTTRYVKERPTVIEGRRHTGRPSWGSPRGEAREFLNGSSERSRNSGRITRYPPGNPNVDIYAFPPGVRIEFKESIKLLGRPIWRELPAPPASYRWEPFEWIEHHRTYYYADAPKVIPQVYTTVIVEKWGLVENGYVESYLERKYNIIKGGTRVSNRTHPHTETVHRVAATYVPERPFVRRVNWYVKAFKWVATFIGMRYGSVDVRTGRVYTCWEDYPRTSSNYDLLQQYRRQTMYSMPRWMRGRR